MKVWVDMTFQTEFDSTSSTWSSPQNLGHPINSPADDFSIVVADGGKIGYIASVKGGLRRYGYL